MATRVEQAKDRLRAAIDESEAIIKDPFMGRNEMYERLKKLRNEFTELVQVVSPY